MGIMRLNPDSRVMRVGYYSIMIDINPLLASKIDDITERIEEFLEIYFDEVDELDIVEGVFIEPEEVDKEIKVLAKEIENYDKFFENDWEKEV